MMDAKTIVLLRKYAAEYETADFLNGDPSWFMHKVDGNENRETTAFVASALSYGNRRQFMPKIEAIVDAAAGNVHEWVMRGDFENFIPHDKAGSYYRLYSYQTMNTFLRGVRKMLEKYGSIGCYVHENADNCLDAVASLCRWFVEVNSSTVVPKDTVSACKRLCMFMRWMVRSNSPVDLGLWASFIDRKSLIIPMDTHVLQQSVRLGLISSKTATMATAIKLTKTLEEIFPDDPVKGDFALFGYGVNNS